LLQRTGLVAELTDVHADALMGHWLREDPGVPGVSGVPMAARAVAAAWEQRTGGRASCRMREALHLLREVIDPARWPRGTCGGRARTIASCSSPGSARSSKTLG